MNFFDQIQERAAKTGSTLCVGIDPRIDKGASADLKRALVDSSVKLIEKTASSAACYKPNIAFFEQHGSRGIEALEQVITVLKDKTIPVILDAKRGDIGATAQAYATGCFQKLCVDAVTLSPYMGRSSAEPFLKFSDKGLFFLCRTSNPGAELLQELYLESGEPLFVEVARQALSWGPMSGLVVAANDTASLNTIRSRFPDAWILAPGIGAQGGSASNAVEAAGGRNIIPVVVRSIAGADDPGEAARRYSSEIKQSVEKKVQSAGFDSLKVRVLKGLIETGCFRVGTFTLKSGLESPFYIDLRRIISSPRLLQDVGMAYAGLLANLSYDRIAGIPTAGLPLAAAAALAAGKPMIFPRMSAKGHGTGNKVEGEWKKDETAVLLDDLITTGGSKIEAADILTDAGMKVTDLVVLLERGTSGRKDMNARGINLHAFAHVEELFDLSLSMGIINEEKLQELRNFVKKA